MKPIRMSEGDIVQVSIRNDLPITIPKGVSEPKSAIGAVHGIIRADQHWIITGDDTQFCSCWHRIDVIFRKLS